MSIEAKMVNLKIKSEEVELATPVLKWAGGKSQLLPIITSHYPKELHQGKVDTYVEPFVGGGAVFFDIANKYKFREAFIFDLNPELIIVYNSIKKEPYQVIEALRPLEQDYLAKSDEARKDFFYEVREKFNSGVENSQSSLTSDLFNPERAATTIFLNRTCFNGLFRVNSQGGFNVPHGKYKNPHILFAEKILAASNALERANIIKADFSECAKYIRGRTFIYYDPPYRPVSKTAQFTAYSKETFDDHQQRRLAELILRLNQQGVLQLLSNSDPTNYLDDPFFDELYQDLTIVRIEARRMINSDASKRGALREILVRNY